MKIYSPHPKAHIRNEKRFQATTQTIYVTPGRTDPTSEFMTKNDDGQLVPKQFSVQFVNGEADVFDALAKWMVDKGHALKTKRLIKLPGEDD